MRDNSKLFGGKIAETNYLVFFLFFELFERGGHLRGGWLKGHEYSNPEGPVASLASIFGHERRKKTPTPSRSAIFDMNNSIQLGDFHEIFSGTGKCRLEGEQPQLGALLTMVINHIMMVINQG